MQQSASGTSSASSSSSSLAAGRFSGVSNSKNYGSGSASLFGHSSASLHEKSFHSMGTSASHRSSTVGPNGRVLMIRLAMLSVAQICQQLGVDRYQTQVIRIFSFLFLQRVEQLTCWLARIIETAGGRADFLGIDIEAITNDANRSNKRKREEEIDREDEEDVNESTSMKNLESLFNDVPSHDMSMHSASQKNSFNNTTLANDALTDAESCKTPVTLRNFILSEIGAYDAPGFLDHFNYIKAQKRWLRSFLKGLGADSLLLSQGAQYADAVELSGQDVQKGLKEGKKKKVMLPSEALLALLKSVPKIPTMKGVSKHIKRQESIKLERKSKGIMSDEGLSNFPASIAECFGDQLSDLPKPPPIVAMSKSSFDVTNVEGVLSPAPLFGGASISGHRLASAIPSRPASSTPSLNISGRTSTPQPLLPLTLNFFATRWDDIPPVSSKSYFSGHALVSPSVCSSQGVGISIQTNSSSSSPSTPLPVHAFSSASSSTVTSPTKSSFSLSQANVPRVSSPLSRMAMSAFSFREVSSSPLGQSICHSTSTILNSNMGKIFGLSTAESDTSYSAEFVDHDLGFTEMESANVNDTEESMQMSTVDEADSFGFKSQWLMSVIRESTWSKRLLDESSGLLDFELKATSAALSSSLSGDLVDDDITNEIHSPLWTSAIHRLWMNLTRQSSSPAEKDKHGASLMREQTLELTATDIYNLKNAVSTSLLAASLNGVLWASQINSVLRSASLARGMSSFSFDASLPSSTLSAISQFHFPTVESQENSTVMEVSEFEALSSSTSSLPIKEVPVSRSATLMTSLTSFYPLSQSIMVSGWNGLSNGSMLLGWYIDILAFAKSRFLCHEEVLLGKSMPYLFASLPPSLLPSYSSSTLISIPTRKISISKSGAALPSLMSRLPPIGKLSKQWTMMRNKMAAKKLSTLAASGQRPIHFTVRKKQPNHSIDVVVVTSSKTGSSIRPRIEESEKKSQPLLKFSNAVMDRWKASPQYKTLHSPRPLSTGLSSNVPESKVKQLSTGKYVLQTGKVGRPKLLSLPKILLPNVQKQKIKQEVSEADARIKSKSHASQTAPKLKLKLTSPVGRSMQSSVSSTPKNETKSDVIYSGYESGEGASVHLKREEDIERVRPMTSSGEEDIDILTLRDSPKKQSPSSSLPPLSLKLRLSTPQIKKKVSALSPSSDGTTHTLPVARAPPATSSTKLPKLKLLLKTTPKASE